MPPKLNLLQSQVAFERVRSQKLGAILHGLFAFWSFPRPSDAPRLHLPPSSLSDAMSKWKFCAICSSSKKTCSLHSNPLHAGIGEMALRMLIFFWQIAVSFLSFSSPLTRTGILLITQLQKGIPNICLDFLHNETNQLLICTALEGQLS